MGVLISFGFFLRASVSEDIHSRVGGSGFCAPLDVLLLFVDNGA